MLIRGYFICIILTEKQTFTHNMWLSESSKINEVEFITTNNFEILQIVDLKTFSMCFTLIDQTLLYYS